LARDRPVNPGNSDRLSSFLADRMGLFLPLLALGVSLNLAGAQVNPIRIEQGVWGAMKSG
jgi:hypothetical protein